MSLIEMARQYPDLSVTIRFGRKVYYKDTDIQAIIEAHSGTRTNH